jgi:hypothetical protein
MPEARLKTLTRRIQGEEYEQRLQKAKAEHLVSGSDDGSFIDDLSDAE